MLDGRTVNATARQRGGGRLWIVPKQAWINHDDRLTQQSPTGVAQPSSGRVTSLPANARQPASHSAASR